MGFKEFFVSYGKFHDNTINKLIHIVGIPTILFCVFGTFHYYPLLEINCVYKQLDVGLLLMCILPFVYIYVEPLTGIVSTIIYHAMYYFSLQNWNIHKDDQDYMYGVTYYRFLLYLQAAGWIAQFIGHGVFEGRKPALFNNILTTMVAPDFVVIEVMYFFGYNKKQIGECQKIIDEDIRKYRNESKVSKQKSK